MIAEWSIHTDCRDRQKGLRVVDCLLGVVGLEQSRVNLKIGSQTPPQFQLGVPLNAGTWAEAIVEVIRLAQRVGRAWMIAEDIESSFELVSSQSSVSGVTLQQIRLVDDSRNH